MSKSYQAPLNWYTGGDADTDVNETEEWLTAFEQVVEIEGRERACFLLKKLLEKGYEKDVILPFTANTPYINTIPLSEQPPFPGNREIERRIKSLVRWNAMAMVVRANKKFAGIGGHISTFASAATLYEVGFNHFFRGAARAASAATWSTSRATPRPASTPAPSSKAGLSGAAGELPPRAGSRAAACRPIRTPG